LNNFRGGLTTYFAWNPVKETSGEQQKFDVRHGVRSKKKEEAVNTVSEAINKRRSIRSYQSKPVSRDIVEAIINDGNEALSAMNSKPWRFVVVENEEVKKKLLRASLPHAKKILETVKESDPARYEAITKRLNELPDPVYYSAPVIVFVIGTGRYASHSCPLACENMMLAAYSMGIGSCWVGFGSMVTADDEVKRILELKEEEMIFGPILLGYAEIYHERPIKREPLVKWV
jgi:nitroreductase